jgi:hypothetical protein
MSTIATPDGRTLPAERVEVSRATEPFATYRLEDGTVVRARMIVLSALRATGAYGTDGKPVYAFVTQQVFDVVSAPDALCRPEHTPTERGTT